jgi:hypothetical protein
MCCDELLATPAQENPPARPDTHEALAYAEPAAPSAQVAILLEATAVWILGLAALEDVELGVYPDLLVFNSAWTGSVNGGSPPRHINLLPSFQQLLPSCIWIARDYSSDLQPKQSGSKHSAMC